MKIHKIESKGNWDEEKGRWAGCLRGYWLFKEGYTVRPTITPILHRDGRIRTATDITGCVVLAKDDTWWIYIESAFTGPFEHPNDALAMLRLM